MGVITNFLDAIRRIGGPTQRSALMRQDDYLDNAIRKRIHDREQGFFNPIYVSLEQASGKDWAAIDAR